MMRSARIGLIIGSAWLLGTAATAQETAAGGDLNAGRDLAARFCTECHVVAADQSIPPVRKPPAMSFADIANRRGDSPKALHDFLLSTHRNFDGPPNMPRMWLTHQEADDVVAYIMSLRTRR
jgi:mono/diheme cytochrome c family protein